MHMGTSGPHSPVAIPGIAGGVSEPSPSPELFRSPPPPQRHSQGPKEARGRGRCQSSETQQLINEGHHFTLRGGSGFLLGTKRPITSIGKGNIKRNWAVGKPALERHSRTAIADSPNMCLTTERRLRALIQRNIFVRVMETEYTS